MVQIYKNNLFQVGIPRRSFTQFYSRKTEKQIRFDEANEEALVFHLLLFWRNKFTRIGRRIETEFEIVTTLTKCVTSHIQLFLCKQAVHNCKQLAYWKLDLGCPKLFKRVLQMVIHLILSAYPCTQKGSDSAAFKNQQHTSQTVFCCFEF